MMLTFFCIFKPFHKLFHLFQKDTFAFSNMCILIPFQNGLFT